MPADPPPFTIRPMRPDEADTVATLIHHSTNAWYARRNLGPIFPGEPATCRVFPDTYEQLDPGCCLVAATPDNQILGSCFYHPRDTHIALGIMNADLNTPVRGVAKALLHAIIDIAQQADKPLRLVSSCFNLDSFSLYTRAGLVPYQLYQDMMFRIPDQGLPPHTPTHTLHDGTPADLDEIDTLERDIWQTSRRRDWDHFLRNSDGLWHVTTARDHTGTLVGALASVNHPGSNMLGPGLARDDDTAYDLLHAELDHHRGRSPVFLVPCDHPDLVRRLYTLGARNCELHVGQCLGPAPDIQGVVLPTFLPETG